MRFYGVGFWEVMEVTVSVDTSPDGRDSVRIGKIAEGARLHPSKGVEALDLLRQLRDSADAEIKRLAGEG